MQTTRRSIATSTLGAGLAAVALMANAHAAGAQVPSATTLAPGHAPGLDVDAGGVAHVAWSPPSGGRVGEPLTYCAIAPAAGLGCAPRELYDDGGSVGLAARTIVQTGPLPGSVLILSPRLGRPGRGAQDDAVLVSSLNGGAGFGAPAHVGIGFVDADFGRDGTATVAGSVLDSRVQRLGLSGPPADTRAQPLPASGAGASIEHHRGRPLLVSSRASGEQWSLWSGRGDANDVGTWSRPSGDFTDATAYDLASGPRGVFFTGARGDGERRIEVRRFTGAGFTRATNVNRGHTRGKVDATSSAQDARGRVLVAWHDRSSRTLFASASLSGRRWSRPVAVARRAGSAAAKLTVALGPDGTGVAVWEEGETRVMAARVSLARVLRGR